MYWQTFTIIFITFTFAYKRQSLEDYMCSYGPLAYCMLFGCVFF